MNLDRFYQFIIKTFSTFNFFYVSCHSHLSQEFPIPQALQNGNEPALPAHTTLRYQDPLQAQVGQIQNLQPD